MRRLAQLPNPLSSEHLDVGIEAAVDLDSSYAQPSADHRVGKDVELFLDNMFSWRNQQRSEQFSTTQATMLAKLISTSYSRKQKIAFFEDVVGCFSGQEVVNWLSENLAEFSSDMFELREQDSNSSKNYFFEASSPEIEARVRDRELIVAQIVRMPVQKRFCFAKDVNSEEEFFVPFVTNFGDKWHVDILSLGTKLALRPADGNGSLRAAKEWYFLASE